MSENPFSTEGGADERNKSEEEKTQELPPKFEEGKENSHQANDSSMLFRPCIPLLFPPPYLPVLPSHDPC
jgi:hypothetical protein